MKKILLFAIAAMVFSVSYAQDESSKRTLEQRKQEIKDRAEILKLNVKGVNNELMKRAKKEAKRLTKEGWQVSAGSLPLEDQLYRVYEKEFTMSDSSFPKYIIGRSQATGSSLQGAKTQTSALSRIEIAEQINAEVAQLTEVSLGNNEISDEEATSITTTMTEAQQFVSASLGRTINLLEIHRKLANGNYQFQMTVSYDGNRAKAEVLKAFENKSSELKEALKKVLGEK